MDVELYKIQLTFNNDMNTGLRFLVTLKNGSLGFQVVAKYNKIIC